MSDSLFRKLWLDKLPAQTTQILATLPVDLDLLKTAEIADKINPGVVLTPPLVRGKLRYADITTNLATQQENVRNRVPSNRKQILQQLRMRETPAPAASEGCICCWGANHLTVYFILRTEIQTNPSLSILAHKSALYHPDLPFQRLNLRLLYVP